MTNIRTYLSTFLLAICMFSVMLNQVHAVEIKTTESSIENRYSFVSIVAVILAGPYHYFKRFFSNSVIIKPNVKQEVVLQESLNLISNPSVTESVTVPLSDTTETVDLEQVSPIELLVIDKLETQAIKILNNHNQPLQISLSSLDDDCILQESLELISKTNEMESVTVPLSDTTETVKLEQVTSHNHLVVDELETQNIKVMNNHDQSLQISLSSLDEDDCVLHQFSVPSYSYDSINLN